VFRAVIPRVSKVVMAGLDLAIHVLRPGRKDVDARLKAGHPERSGRVDRLT
jgi:hypothetical protein